MPLSPGSIDICREHARGGRRPYPVDDLNADMIPRDAPRTSLMASYRYNVVFLTDKEADDALRTGDGEN